MFVSCYAPTLNSSEQEKDDFYDLLREVISNVQHRDKLVLMGDFNARVGSDNHYWKRVLGSHGVGRMNSNSLRLLTICRDFNLSITNTFEKQSNCRNVHLDAPQVERLPSFRLCHYQTARHQRFQDHSLLSYHLLLV